MLGNKFNNQKKGAKKMKKRNKIERKRLREVLFIGSLGLFFLVCSSICKAEMLVNPVVKVDKLEAKVNPRGCKFVYKGEGIINLGLPSIYYITDEKIKQGTTIWNVESKKSYIFARVEKRSLLVEKTYTSEGTVIKWQDKVDNEYAGLNIEHEFLINPRKIVYTAKYVVTKGWKGCILNIPHLLFKDKILGQGYKIIQIDGNEIMNKFPITFPEKWITFGFKISSLTFNTSLENIHFDFESMPAFNKVRLAFSPSHSAFVLSLPFSGEHVHFYPTGHEQSMKVTITFGEHGIEI